MEIEVGEYVRTKYTGISKIVKIVYWENTTTIRYYLDNKRYSIFPHLMLKHSKNIIDLIETGDYVNEYKILKLEKSRIREDGICILIYRDNQEEQWETIFAEEVKTILTKEQYEQNCYKVGEE